MRDWYVCERDAQHASLETKATYTTTRQAETRQKHHQFPCMRGLNDTRPFLMQWILHLAIFFSMAFVLPCLKSDACGGKNPGVIPTAELHQPKYNNILTTVI